MDIQEYRELRGYTQKELANRMQITINALSNIETGRVKKFTPKMRKNYMKVFNLLPERLEEIWQETKEEKKQVNFMAT